MASNQPNVTQGKLDYGFKLARAGFNAETATDYELLFNSAWPSLAIAFTKTITIPAGAFGVAQFNHPLGFPPFAMAWVIEGGIVTRRVFPSISSTTIFIEDGAATSSAIYYVQCYNLDISAQVSYNYIASPPAQIGTYDTNYGVKFAKPGKLITSNELNDFIFHSRAMSPAILAVITTFDAAAQIGNSSTITYTNPHNYVPWAFGYGSEDGVLYNPAPPYSQTTPRLFVNLVNQNSFTLSCSAGSKTGSLIMLRDPLFVPNSLRVVY